MNPKTPIGVVVTSHTGFLYSSNFGFKTTAHLKIKYETRVHLQWTFFWWVWEYKWPDRIFRSLLAHPPLFSPPPPPKSVQSWSPMKKSNRFNKYHGSSSERGLQVKFFDVSYVNTTMIKEYMNKQWHPREMIFWNRTQYFVRKVEIPFR
jgi:hypothetical protein